MDLPGTKPARYSGTSLIRKRLPPQGHHMFLGIVLVEGPKGWRVFMSEEPRYCCRANSAHARQPRPEAGLSFQVKIPQLF